MEAAAGEIKYLKEVGVNTQEIKEPLSRILATIENRLLEEIKRDDR